MLELDLAVKPWNGPGVLMANGQRGSQLGAVDIELENTRGRVGRKILMMQMDEVQLLLGMDLLSSMDESNWRPLEAEWEEKSS